MNAEEKLQRAKVRLVLDQPFYAALLMELRWKKTKDVQTMTTNGQVLLWNPEFVDKLDQDCVGTVLAHEAMHCALLHHTRRCGRNLEQWNHATDYAINNLLNAYSQKFTPRPFPFPEVVLLNPAYNGMSAEQIYDALQNQPKPQPQSGGQGKPKPDKSGGNGSQPQPNQSGQQDGGSGEYPQAKDMPGGIGDVMDAPGSEADKSDDEAKWKQAMVNAVVSSKRRGKCPAEMERLVEEFINPKPKWQEVLRRFVRDNAKDDYSWTRPNMRYAHTGFLLPSLYSQRLGTIAIVRDTSGSMLSVMEEIMAEMEGIVAETRPRKVIALDCDAKIHNRWELDPTDPLPRKFKGGGGTSHVPVWKELENDEVVCCVCLTDMYTDFGKDPGYPVLWATKTDHVTPPFGEVVRIV